MTNTITIAAIRNQIVLLGKELEFASGIRAVAAEQRMKGGVSGPDMLFDLLEKTICSDQLFESYHDPLNGEEGDLVLGEGVPFPSLEAYIALHAHYGKEWLAHAMTDYCAHFGSVELRSDPEQFAKDYLERSRDNLNHAEKPAPKESPFVVFGREYELFKGLRPLALAATFPESGEPIDCFGRMVDECIDRLGDDYFRQGIESEDAFVELFSVCFDLHQQHGSSDWIKQGLLGYLAEAKGLSDTDAEQEADRLIHESNEWIALLDSIGARGATKRAVYLTDQLIKHKHLTDDYCQQLASELVSAAA
ncbi:hypothetical protein [Pseudomonas sp. DNDY-54]|uniref:hypothetical protein n=1 Tax=Pseudomonas sp. DNDY-54 TaxID=2870860 RepID=UPI001CA42AEB|nr:hypothetical protein [Pseudomonas sp. DNDY-54]